MFGSSTDHVDPERKRKKTQIIQQNNIEHTISHRRGETSHKPCGWLSLLLPGEKMEKNIFLKPYNVKRCPQGAIPVFQAGEESPVARTRLWAVSLLVFNREEQLTHAVITIQ